jgi:hypothetical protein
MSIKMYIEITNLSIHITEVSIWWLYIEEITMFSSLSLECILSLMSRGNVPFSWFTQRKVQKHESLWRFIKCALWTPYSSLLKARLLQVHKSYRYCSITFNSYSHASHPQKPTKKFVSHSITRVIYERVRRIQKSGGAALRGTNSVV